MTNLLDLMDRSLGGVAFDAQPLARELAAYGEPEAARMLLSMDSDTHRRISVEAGKLLGQKVTIDRAICLAAVAVFEGKPRELCRKRRVYPKPEA